MRSRGTKGILTNDLDKPDLVLNPLWHLHAATHLVSVLRDGQWFKLPANVLVKGDVISLKAGDRTPARVKTINSTEVPVSAPFFVYKLDYMYILSLFFL